MQWAVLGLPALYFFLNRFRGTLGAGGPIVGAVTGLIVFLLTGNPLVAVGIAIAYALGEAPGWGRWIKLLNKNYTQQEYWNNHREPSRGKEIHWLANKIAREKTDYRKYAMVAMGLRGLLWWLPVALVPTLLLGAPTAPVGLLGALTPYCIRAARNKVPFWRWQEHYSGVLHGLILALIIIQI